MSMNNDFRLVWNSSYRFRQQYTGRKYPPFSTYQACGFFLGDQFFNKYGHSGSWSANLFPMSFTVNPQLAVTELHRKQTHRLPSLCFCDQVDPSTNMVTLASAWSMHFRLLLCVYFNFTGSKNSTSPIEFWTFPSTNMVALASYLLTTDTWT